MNKDIKFGKNIIGTLTEGMYENSRFIYREYIQNAADQIDIATHDGLLDDGEGVIDIRIDPGKREIIICDNATGIPSQRVYALLGNVAASTKDRTKQKGFRGIGRLGGLGYCHRLIFETSCAGEECKTIMTWDAAKLKQLLNDHKITLDAIAVIKDVTEISTEPCAKDLHYFKVKLEHVNETNDFLLNVDDIREYLSMIAPVPFDQGNFYLGRKIYEYIKSEKLPNLDEYDIRINGEKLFKGYKIGIHQISNTGDSSRIDEIKDIVFNKFYNEKDEVIGWCWFGISTFAKAIPDKGNPHRAIRLRKANIQLGESSALNRLHREVRGNHYFVGEIHAIDPELIPNSSRSYFNENKEYKRFECEVRAFFHDKLYKLYYDASTMKNAFKSISDEQQLATMIQTKVKTGFSSATEEKTLYAKYQEVSKKAEEGKKKIEKFKERINDDPLIAKVFQGVKEDHAPKDVVPVPGIPPIIEPAGNKKQGKKFRTDNLTKLSREQRRFLGDVFDIIIKTLTPDMAEALICKIEEEYK